MASTGQIPASASPSDVARGRRLLRKLAPLVLIGLLGSASYLVVRYLGRAELHAEQDLPSDVRAEVDAVWNDFNQVFGDHRTCFDDVTLLLVSEVEGGDARYVIADARIEIKIPTSPSRFRDSLAHELAHHLEHTCGRFADLKADFQRLPGVDGDTWATGPVWQEAPSELYAETVVELVNGERVRHGRSMPLPAGAAALVASWAETSEAG